jgi:small subunit ribosomal protein S6
MLARRDDRRDRDDNKFGGRDDDRPRRPRRPRDEAGEGAE